MLKKKKPSKHLPSGETLLTAAVREECPDTLTVLLERGSADLNINECNENGLNALHFAVIKGNTQLVQVLLDHNADKDATDGYGMSALHLACALGKLEVVKLLLDNGSCPRGSLHPKVASPIMSAIGTSCDIVSLLITSGVDIHKREVTGNTAYCRAISTGNVAVVKEMISLTGLQLSHTNILGCNLFHEIFKQKHIPPNCKTTKESMEQMSEATNGMQTGEISNTSTTSAEKSRVECSEIRSSFCRTFELILKYVENNLPVMGDLRKALTAAMPSCVHIDCVKCFKTALPYIDIHHIYTEKDGATSDILMHTILPDYVWSAVGPNWSVSGYSESLSLDGMHQEMVLILLEKGVSLSLIHHVIISRLYGHLFPYSVADIYCIYIKAWGGWYPDHHVSKNLFKKLILTGFLYKEVKLLCLAGYTPNEDDLLLSRSIRYKNETGNPLREFMAQFTYNPRSLFDNAAICVRRSLCDNVWHKVKFLQLPITLRDHITMKNMDF